MRTTDTPRPPVRRRRTQQERREDTRQALLEGMMSALIDVGYARATTTEITRRAGLTSGALQHHFATKEELVLAVVQYQFDEARGQLEAYADAPPGEAGDWRPFIALLGDIFAGRRYMAVWEIVLGTRGDQQLHAAVMQHRVQSLGILETLWRRVFDRHIGDRHLSADLMHFTMSVLRGFVFYSVIAPDERFFERQKEILFSFLEGQMGDVHPPQLTTRAAGPGKRRPKREQERAG